MGHQNISGKRLKINRLISKRRLIQAIIGTVLYLLIQYFQISLWYVLILGVLTGVLFGKVFCKWMCPLGFVMEVFMNISPEEKFRNTYQYHKVGCPIAWASGVLNRISIFNISFDESGCKHCGACDKACYISTLNKDFSLHKKNKKDPSRQFSCSKCLQCVAVCPKDSLKYKFQKFKL